MDTSVDPCNNFYTFACGGFNSKAVIEDDKTSFTTFTVIRNKLEEQGRKLMEESILEDDPKPYKIVKTFFSSCMDTESIEALGVAPLKSKLEALGGWPLINSEGWKDDEFLWHKFVRELQKNDFDGNGLVQLSVSQDVKNSSWRALHLGQPGLGMEKEYFDQGLQSKPVQAYMAFIKELCELLGGKPENSQLLEMIEFEMKLANISVPRGELRDLEKQYNPMKISELSKINSDVPWLDYINSLLTDFTDQVTEEERVIVRHPSYISKLAELIRDTPKKVQAIYLISRAVVQSTSFLTKAVDAILLKFSKVLSGTVSTPPRWRTCLQDVNLVLPQLVGSMYVKKYFNMDSRRVAEEMVFDLRLALEMMINELDWMDEGTKLQAKEKLKKMASHVGYPVELLDMKKLEEYFGSLDMKPDKFYDNYVQIGKWDMKNAFVELREKVNKTDWKAAGHGTPAMVNAYYNGRENSIILPAGILQGAFFEGDRPNYLNFGGIGFAIGHEITHGFDDTGRLSNAEGNVEDWWDPETATKYLSMAKCIIDQYNNFTLAELDNLRVNGINTQGENIADLGGLKMAYRAYSKWVSEHGSELKLPGLPHSPKQLFWVGAAQIWCGKLRPEALRNKVLTGAHSPRKFRIEGPFSSLKDFSKDFNCPAGSLYNPEKRCQVW